MTQQLLIPAMGEHEHRGLDREHDDSGRGELHGEDAR